MPKDKRIDRGIYQTPHGFRIVLRLNGQLHRERFPPTYTLSALRRWRDDHERLHRRTIRRGTFAEDVREYLRAVAAMPSLSDRTREIDAWLPAFGTRARWSLIASEIREQLAIWRATKAASTCNHRRTALSHLFTVLDGKRSPNPVRDVPPFPEPKPMPRGKPIATALQLLRRVHGFTRTRCLLLLWTGMRPAELMRVTAEDLDLEHGVCWVRTAKGGDPRPVVLNTSAVKAFRRFVRLAMWGKFSTASVRKSLLRAAKKDPPIAWTRVYDLRHTHGTALRTHADRADVQAQLGHRSPRHTDRYAPLEIAKLRKATEAMRKFPDKVPTKKSPP